MLKYKERLWYRCIKLIEYAFWYMINRIEILRLGVSLKITSTVRLRKTSRVTARARDKILPTKQPLIGFCIQWWTKSVPAVRVFILLFWRYSGLMVLNSVCYMTCKSKCCLIHPCSSSVSNNLGFSYRENSERSNLRVLLSVSILPKQIFTFYFAHLLANNFPLRHMEPSPSMFQEHIYLSTHEGVHTTLRPTSSRLILAYGLYGILSSHQSVSQSQLTNTDQIGFLRSMRSSLHSFSTRVSPS